VAYPFFLTKLLVRSGLARFLPAARRATDGGAAFLGYYSDRVLAAPYEEVAAAAALLERHAPDAIDLALGAPRFDLVPSGSTKLPAERRGWPPPGGLADLRAAVAEHLRTEQGLTVSPQDEVLITHGAAGAFNAVAEAFVNPGDPVVLFDPTTPLHILGLRHRRARLRWVPTWLEDGRTRFHLEDLARALHRARLLVLTSPANPTGGVLAPEDLEQIAWWAAKRDVLVCSDQVFGRYVYEGRNVEIGSLAGARGRTLTLGSLSKGHALAAVRVGWLAGHRHLIRPCALVAGLHAPFVPTVCQQIALTALRQGADAFGPMRTEFAARRRYAFERLQSVGLKPAWPAGAFFFWMPVHVFGLSGREFADRLLRAKRVHVTPGDFFGPSGASHIRISYAIEDGRLREGLSRLAEFVRELRGVAVPDEPLGFARGGEQPGPQTAARGAAPRGSLRVQ
jgi:aspartate/methionine/tyrosine aminotransferase